MILWHTFVNLLPFEWAQYSFMHNALLAICIITPLFALLGCTVINNQMAFFSEAIGHAGLTGIAIGVLAGIANPLWAMIVFAILIAIGVTLLRRYSAASSDTVIGIIMAFTVAVGVLLLSRGGGFNKYSQYLIGDILSITQYEIFSLLVVFVIFLICWIFLFNRLFLVSINSSLARSRNINIWLMQAIIAIVTAVIVTVSLQWVGILVINALIILPAAASRNMARSIAQYLWGAIVISLLSGICGLIVSYYWSTATGATIVIFAMTLYLGTLVVGRVKGRG